MKNGISILAIAAAALFLAGADAAGAQESIVLSFPSPGCAAQPDSAPVFDAKGNLYGTCQDSSGDGFVYELSPKAGGGWTGQAIYIFGADGTTDEGSGPNGVVFDAQKVNLFGTASAGGSQGGGVVYELSPNGSGGWTQTVIYSFGTNGGNDGVTPMGSLVLDAAGNLYGTTSGGGANFNSGTAFELTPSAGGIWTETVIHSFSFLDSVGSTPQNGLIFDGTGNLYGTTNGGAGTVFELSPAGGGIWTVQPIGFFTYFSNPAGNLIFDGSGNLYGVSTAGGAYGIGAVYEWSPTSGGTWTAQTIYSFGQAGNDGGSPKAGVILGPKGVLYGTTAAGGSFSGTEAPAGYGTIYELIPGAGSWTEKILYNFDDSNYNDGFHPDTDLALDTAGNLYGSSSGGANDLGAVFELTAPGTVDPPQFLLSPGTYIQPQSVEIVDPTPNSTIYYTTNGTKPTTGSTKYTGAITVSATETIEAIGVASGLTNSPVATATYTITPPAATPTFSPAAGVYATAQKVTITDATSGAVIYYTTNGTTPTTSSAKFSTAISVSASETLQAVAIAPGYSISNVADAAYIIETPAATPVISPATGTYTASQMVTITDTTPGAVIYYTTSGATPTTSSTKYGGQFKASASETIEAIAVAPDYLQSAVATAKYTITPPAATPTFSPVAGTYPTTQKVTISDATANAIIYYTTNGASPTTLSTKYTGTITVSASETIQAIAAATGFTTSAVETAAYLIETPTATPAFSLPPGAYSGTQTVTITDATPGAVVYYTTNGATPTTSSTQYTSAISVTATETLEAIAVAPDYLPSGAATAKYIIAAPTATPTFTPAAGTYFSPQSVTIQDTTSDAAIYYTVDGTKPTTASAKYTGAIAVTATEIIQAIAVGPVNPVSAVASSIYEIDKHESVLYNFSATAKDAGVPQGKLISDAKGNLYGTTFFGGDYGGGTVFELMPNGNGGWTETVLHSFGATPSDPGSLTCGLVFDAKGNLYGTTFGSVFELTPAADGSWTETLIAPLGLFSSGVIFGKDGNLYGTTSLGGTNNDGAVFELTPGADGNWTNTVLYSFGAGSADGTSPQGGLIFDAKGNLYGTTTFGGIHSGSFDLGGTAFELSPGTDGTWTETVLYSFGANGDGQGPVGPLLFDAKGNLYGATNHGGLYGGEFLGGTAFELTPTASGSWKETVLHDFGGAVTDGVSPDGGLIFDAAGNLYGAAGAGGTKGFGTAFELSPGANGSWNETSLYNFDLTVTDGANPNVVIFDSKGNLTGTAGYGGAYGTTNVGPDSNKGGTVFEIEATAEPVLTPAAGTYVSGQKVTIADATAGATIYYTTNGAAPTTASAKYSSALSLSAAETIKAIAVSTGYLNSLTASATYGIGTATATPVITPAAGTYASAQTITMTDATSGAAIYYTTNGAAPTTASTRYGAAFKLSSSATVKAIAVAKGYAQSTVASSAYTIKTPVATPVFTPGAGTYTSTQSVKIADSTTGAAIYYTTNGNTPTASSTKYTAPISVAATTKIEAIAIAAGHTNSAVASATFTIVPPPPTIALSPKTLAFPNTTAGTTTAPLAITVANTGAGNVTLTSISIAGANSSSFPQVNDCGSLLASGASCTVFVAFKPPSPGAKTATLKVTDNASGSPQTVALSGTAIAADTVTFSQTSLVFTATTVGSTTEAQSVTVTNAGASTLDITGIAITGANATSFNQVSTCGTTLAPAANCLIYVAFKPVSSGTLTGSVTMSDTGAASPQTIKLTGTGTN